MHKLLQQLSDGHDVVNEVIELEMPLAYKLAQKYVRRHRHKTNDIRSISLLALVEGVQQIFNQQTQADEIEPLLNRIISNSLIDFVNNDHFIKIPKRSIDRSKGKIKRPIVFSLHVMQKDSGQFYENSKLESFLDVQDYYTSQRNHAKEIYEELRSQLSDFEAKILSLRLYGHTQASVAEILKVSPQWISLQIQNIKGKFNDLSIHQRREMSLS